VTAGAASGFVVNLLLGWFFGFAIAAFQEETLFRGFLQGLLQERYGRIVAIVGQAAIFTLVPRVLPGLRVAAAPRRVPRRYRHWMAR